VKSSKPSYLPTFGTKRSSAAASQNENTEINEEDNVSKAATVGTNRLGHPAAEWSLQKFKTKKPEPVEGILFKL